MLSYAKKFVESVVELTVNDREVLLICDGCHSHIGYKVISTLQKGNVIPYCLPAHTSGTTQPPDFGIFSPFKYYLQEGMYAVARTDRTMENGQFDLARFVTQAYYKAFSPENIKSAFSPENIKSAFKHTGIWLCDPTALFEAFTTVRKCEKSVVR